MPRTEPPCAASACLWSGMSITPNPTNRLVRPGRGRVLGGVCAGLAHRLGMSPNVMRALWVASCILPGPQVLAYLALWVVMPQE